MNYMIGCNYWGSKYGTEMWKYWDGKSVDKDLEELAKYGVKYMRVFPNWRDFQPLVPVYGVCNTRREYRLHGEELMSDEFGLDEACMSHFEEFLGYVKKHGMKVIVAVLTGWMSGRTFTPPALYDKNLISDPEALKLEIKFVKGFVRRFKDSDVIEHWDLGNECNNLSNAVCEEEAYVWTASIANAIRSEDPTRMIHSGLHGIYSEGIWNIRQQGEICDMLTPHPYPSPTVNGDRDVMTGPRTSYVTTEMVEYYSGVSGKPALVQEAGTLNGMIGNKDMVAQFAKLCIYSGWANGSQGYLWWCAHEQLHLNYPPYMWSMIERELGLLYEDLSPKPVALQMKECQDVLSSMPFDELPKKKYDAVCITRREKYGLSLCATVQVPYMLCKQAGLELTYRYHQQELPDAALYIAPCIDGWDCYDVVCYDALLEKATNGASVLFTVGSGMLSQNEVTLGLISYGLRNNTKTINVDFDGDVLPIRYEKEYIMRANTAEVLAKDDNGNVVFSRNKYGKGYIYYLAFPMERMLAESEDYLRDAEKYPYYKIYAKCAEDTIANKFAKSPVPDVGVTAHWLNDKECIVIVINYSGKDVDPKLDIKAHSKCDILYGKINHIPVCDMTVLKVTVC